MSELMWQALKEWNEGDFYPFHMPGHKRNRRLLAALGIWGLGLHPSELDITEIPGFDDLHEAKGMIKRAEEVGSLLYGAKKTFFQVNGSTGAILSAIGGATTRGDTVLVARNCHKSVYHAIELFGLKPIYLQPRVDHFGICQGITVSEVEEKLSLAKIKGIKPCLLILTSPTYEGLVSEIDKIAALTKKEEILFMVDEAHGAHFGISKSGYFPESAVRLGADLVVQSLHKTLPSFTQTALLHVVKEDERLVERIKKKNDCLETSSPSYLMMASMEACLVAMRDRGEELFLSYENRLKLFYEKIRRLQYIHLYEREEGKDPGKLVISAGKGSGSFLYDYLYEDCHLVMEMKARDYVIAMTSILDTEEGFLRLSLALISLDERIRELAKEGKFYYTFHGGEGKDEKTLLSLPKQWSSPAKAQALIDKNGKVFVPLRTAIKRIAADYVYFYPPGIPLVVPGEIIDSSVVEEIKKGLEAGIQIYGGSDGHGIFVCADGKERDREG